MMLNKTEQDERQYLEVIQGKLKLTLEGISERVRKYAREIQEQKEYLWENKSGMDHVEKITVRQSVDQFVYTGEAIKDKSRRLHKLLETPYFGRFDFTQEENKEGYPIYIGVHAFFDEDTNESLIHDWRAPISSMFYDFETGEAHFLSPDGEVSGEIVLKRQYRIRQGQMEFMIESDINIHDEVLQKELSCAADDKMKNIVATIQRDQNKIIRNENSQVLIIQGVAGSGKTSIALHRIAFLLYRYKGDFSSKDLLIISPNKVFADYISNVLPELGEETIPEIAIEELAKDLLNREFQFQTFYEQVTLLLEKNDPAFQQRIEFKASFDFLNKMDAYVEHVKQNYFQAHDVCVRSKVIPKEFLSERFASYTTLPIERRLIKLAKDVEAQLRIYKRCVVTSKERGEIKKQVNKMFQYPNLKALYKDFYQWLGKPEMCVFIKALKLEYSDVFPMIYFKMHWSGMDKYDEVKHLLVDEMQDYTPVQYAVLAKLFECKKTILGDANQSVNPFSSSTHVAIQQVFDDSDCVRLNKSYRSTFEITQFAQRISPNAELEAVERYGTAPEVLACKNKDDQIDAIVRLIEQFHKGSYHSMGIVCKTEALAEELFDALTKRKVRTYILTSESDAYRQGVVVISAHMAKGLEFDHVIVPDATRANYASPVDKRMLYVACTRAMHQLTITHADELTSFVML